MDLDVVFLGTGGSAPTARRSTAAVLVRRGGERLLFDCGEGTQRQMQRSLGLVQVDEIFITHFHADHYLGLPGLLKTYDLGDRSEPLRITGPRGLGGLYDSMSRIVGRLGYPVELTELEPGEELDGDGYGIEAFAVDHRIEALGYALAEDDRPGRLDPEAAAARGITGGPDLGRLQRGEVVEGPDGPVDPAEVVGDARRGRKLVITGDTRPCDSTRAAAYRADLLVHDGTFAGEDAERAIETGHSTARAAAALAAEVEVGMLALVHISSRYHVGTILEEAEAEFANVVAPRDFDVVELPFPERGEPTLVREGARERPDGA